MATTDVETASTGIEAVVASVGRHLAADDAEVAATGKDTIVRSGRGRHLATADVDSAAIGISA